MSEVLGAVRQRLKEYEWLSASPAMLIWAAVVGVLGALATVLFHEGIYLLQRLFTGSQGSIVGVMQALPWYGRVVFPMLGGVAAGMLLAWAARIKASSNSDYMEAVAIGDGRLSIRQGLLRSLSSLSSVASGGSIGREGAMVHLSSLSASAIGRFASFDTSRLRLLVACGAAAGVAAAYGAPVAGALFIAEIVLGTMAIQSVGPLLIAAALSNATMRWVGHYHVTYPVIESGSAFSAAHILPFVLLGIVSGVLAPQFLRFLDLARKGFRRLGLPLPLRLGLGGLLLGGLLVFMPSVAGNGYSVVVSLLHQPWAWQAVVLMLVCKVAATAFTVGSGAVGGVFTPTIFVGAAFGSLFGQIILLAWPDLAVSPYLFTLVGMGAFLGAATGAPLMAILMIFEMTLSYQVVVPLMLACVLAHFVSRAIAEVAMYDVTLARERDIVLRRQLRHTKLAELVRPAQTVIATTAPVQEALQMFMEYPVKYLYVVNERNIYQGVIAQQDLTSLLLVHGAVQDKRAGDVLRLDFVKTLYADMGLDEAQDQFVKFQGERLPVVSRGDEPVLLGVVYKSSLLEQYSALKKSLDQSGEGLLDASSRRT
ncbi:ClcB-like voltage-gated chloride channel protein [Eoetvoesiella caeni]|uniref:CIC family chloride channel protein n=1 Tax=Eoetvoesiella caeni TaxID=645616 RepID=A0A366HAU4_9BURK|nr:ClcB-like voltage-gated chloride channel protein [Eoetvoesiella caeni]MCI2809298.1 ClcB-like voltage-gated chloride channel protein [Eoetvoesiella caeni]NYT54438.1 ClcB-like voltage-gated chloride channel protein [Eoetvoesiella caeni]RBP39374.1 CIC family chloride channel protein [Eoetvoesiella caeni]